MVRSLLIKLKTFGNECIRVLKITKKPDSFEFKTIAKAAGLGMLIIGGIGFIIQLIKLLLFPGG
ncbi:MAG: protein translocase SEC61 complex subunit gamma [Nanoarchaeota archaeon]